MPAIIVIKQLTIINGADFKPENRKLVKENRSLAFSNTRLQEENDIPKKQNKEYAFLRKTLGREYVDGLLEQVKLSHKGERNYHNRE